MRQDCTFELTIRFRGQDPVGAKTRVLAWLWKRGEREYVEGYVDGIVDPATENPFEGSDPDASPVLFYDYQVSRLERLARQLERAFPTEVVTSLVPIPTEAWQTAWSEREESFQTKRFRVQINGDDLPPETVPSLETIFIEAKYAFGNGQHATTRVTIEALEDLPNVTGPTLDVGTGTGILAIAAAKLGFGPVTATEIDPRIVAEAERNLQRNGISAQVLLTEHPPPGPFGLVLANILVPALHALAPKLGDATMPGGRLLLAGFIARDEPALLERFSTCGLTLEARHELRGWSCLTLLKKP